MEAIGPLLLVLSVPMMLRWVPQNRFFGFRIPATLRHESLWYDANALNGRHLFLLGLFLVLLEPAVPSSMRYQALRMIAMFGFVAIVVSDWRTTNRWERERNGGE